MPTKNIETDAAHRFRRKTPPLPVRKPAPKRSSSSAGCRRTTATDRRGEAGILPLAAQRLEGVPESLPFVLAGVARLEKAVEDGVERRDPLVQRPGRGEFLHRCEDARGELDEMTEHRRRAAFEVVVGENARKHPLAPARHAIAEQEPVQSRAPAESRETKFAAKLLVRAPANIRPFDPGSGWGQVGFAQANFARTASSEQPEHGGGV